MGTPRVPLLWGHCRSSERLPLSLLHQPEKWPQISGGTRLGTSPMSPRGRFLGRGGEQNNGFWGKTTAFRSTWCSSYRAGVCCPYGLPCCHPTGPHGQHHWPEGHPACGGRSQSPIDIATQRALPDPSLPPIRPMGYDHPLVPTFSLTNNGHTGENRVWGVPVSQPHSAPHHSPRGIPCSGAGAAAHLTPGGAAPKLCCCTAPLPLGSERPSRGG